MHVHLKDRRAVQRHHDQVELRVDEVDEGLEESLVQVQGHLIRHDVMTACFEQDINFHAFVLRGLFVRVEQSIDEILLKLCRIYTSLYLLRPSRPGLPGVILGKVSQTQNLHLINLCRRSRIGIQLRLVGTCAKRVSLSGYGHILASVARGAHLICLLIGSGPLSARPTGVVASCAVHGVRL